MNAEWKREQFENTAYLMNVFKIQAGHKILKFWPMALHKSMLKAIETIGLCTLHTVLIVEIQTIPLK